MKIVSKFLGKYNIAVLVRTFIICHELSVLYSRQINIMTNLNE